MNRSANLSALTRRQFLDGALRAAAGSASALSTIGLLNLLGASAAQAQTGDYRALVCVFLYGGNDGYGMLIPRDAARYALYRNPRPNLAIERANLLPIAPVGGEDLGLHPRCVGLQSLFQQNRLAFVANVGTLLAPTTKADYNANRNLPPALFSHNDQQDHWMSGAADRPKLTGWGGRIADLLSSLNGSSPLSLNISIDGNNLFQTGSDMVPYILNQDGVEPIYGIEDYPERFGPYQAALTRALQTGAHRIENAFAKVAQSAIDVGQLTRAALEGAPPVNTAFPDTDLGRQLRIAARMIAARSLLGVRRQVFFVAMGGYDTHDAQVFNHGELMGALSDAVSAFHAATVELGVADRATLYTMSDFGRTWTSNGDGTDHAWASHHFVVGNAVQGGRIFGRLPNYTLDGPDDAGFGRIIPTTSVDQYGATLARWFGVPNGDMPTVFPNLGRFASGDLGILGA
ncbi:MAG: DUF1501 domain-containing protein [Panacagrimonas sp.]